MTFGILEILALILIVVAGLKLILFATKPKLLFDLSKKIYKNPKTMQFFALIASLIVLYFLNKAGISIVTILAVTLFVGTLYGLVLAPYATKMVNAMKPKTFLKDNFVGIIVWVALLIWGIVALI